MTDILITVVGGSAIIGGAAGFLATCWDVREDARDRLAMPVSRQYLNRLFHFVWG